MKAALWNTIGWAHGSAPADPGQGLVY